MALSIPLPSYRFRHKPVRSSLERQELFGRIAPVYDNLNDLLSLGQHRIWKRMTVSWTGVKMGDCALDLCCGSGDLAFLLSEKVGSNGKVTGLDFSKEQLSIASCRQGLAPNACYNNIEWVEGDALELPFSDGYFDAITMGYGLRNVVDKERAMQEIFRVLKPGSRVSVLDFNKSTQPFTNLIQEWMIDNVVVPVATGYGLAKEYEYLKSSIKEFLTDEGAVSSDEDFSGGEMEVQEAQMRGEDRDLKDRLLRRFGSHIGTLKLEFSKKKKKGKLPREARQTLLEWWSVHYKWPYPTVFGCSYKFLLDYFLSMEPHLNNCAVEGDKIALAESTGLDQKQINNWFINQRKRHWKPSENMQLAVRDNLSGPFFADD